MNLKERIEIINQLKQSTSEPSFEIKKEADVADIFVKNTTIQQLLKNSVNRDRNIILLSSGDCDKTIIANYIRSFIDDTVSVDVLSNVSDNLPFATAQKLIVPEPTIKEITKIFELILCDYRTFVFCMNLKTFDNVLESFRALLSLNSPNLNASNIEHLIGVSSAVLVYVNRNEDGLYEITDIGKIVYKNNTAFLDLLYSNTRVESDETIIPVPIIETNKTIVEVEQVEIPVEVEQEQPLIEEKEMSSLEESNVEVSTKTNKYKLLKEKIRNKKSV